MIVFTLSPEEDNVASLNGDHGAVTQMNGLADADVELEEGNVLPLHAVYRVGVNDLARAPARPPPPFS